MDITINKCAIFTNNFNTAENILNKIYKENIEDVVRYNKSRCDLSITLKNGFIYKWVRISDNARGNRFGYAIIDLNTTTYEALCNIILPTLIHCNDINNIVMFYNNNDITLHKLYSYLELFMCVYGKDVKIINSNLNKYEHTIYYDKNKKCVVLNM